MNALILRLKNSINKEVINKIDKATMGQNSFIPINIQNNFLYVATANSSDKEKIAGIIKQKYSETIKFMMISENDMFELLSEFIPKELIKGAKKDDATETKKHTENKKLGEILLKKGIIKEVDLAKALATSKRNHVPIGSTLFTMGLVTLEQLKEVLHDQTGIEVAKTEQLSNQKDFITALPENFIKTHSVIPISSDGKTITVGVKKPLTKDILDQIIYLSGKNPKQLLMTHYEFEDAIHTFFSSQKKETDSIIAQINEEKTGEDAELTLQEQVQLELQNDSSGSVAKFVNQILTNAIDTHSSDIHIEPRLNGYIVRYRKDGMLQKVLDIPQKVELSVIARFKVLSRMNIAENRRPQDGTFSITYKNCSYDFRINTLPVSGKEKVCIRVLAPAVSLASNDKEIKLVGAHPDDIKKITQMVSCPNGIILTSGPTGSGKTTTLYSVLKSLNDESVNITTIEDPIEIKLEGINQSQINAKAGITFASCMRAILRQDPDVILVGEIRDYETLEIAISAALTGHLVLSTVHTNSAAATVTRMIEMGAKDYLVSSTLSGVIAQRLVRKLCDDCKEEYYATREEVEKITKNPEEIEKMLKTPLYRAKGCNKCNFDGYKGRLGIYEMMLITREIKKLIAEGAHDIEIEDAAVKNGMTTLSNSCKMHILNGQTTIDEYVRVLGLVGE